MEKIFHLQKGEQGLFSTMSPVGLIKIMIFIMCSMISFLVSLWMPLDDLILVSLWLCASGTFYS